MPRNLALRVLIRVFAVEWFAIKAVVFTIAAIAFALIIRWGWAALAGAAACVTWGFIIRDEVTTRRDEMA